MLDGSRIQLQLRFQLLSVEHRRYFIKDPSTEHQRVRMARHTGLAFNFSLLLIALSLLPTSLAGTFYNSSSTTSMGSNLSTQTTSSTPISAVQLTTYLTTTPSGTSASTVTTVVGPSPSRSAGASVTNFPAIQSSGNTFMIQHPFFLLPFCAWAACFLTSFRNAVW